MDEPTWDPDHEWVKTCVYVIRKPQRGTRADKAPQNWPIFDRVPCDRPMREAVVEALRSCNELAAQGTLTLTNAGSWPQKHWGKLKTWPWATYRTDGGLSIYIQRAPKGPADES